jgi:hypothetical protein
MRDHVSGLLLQVLAGLAVLAACRPEPDWGDGAVDPMENPRTENATGGSRANGAGASGGNASGAAAAANGGTGSAARGGAAASAGGAGEAEGAAGGGDTEPNPDVACDGQDVSWEEIQSGQVRVGAGITLDAIVTSQKFLVSHSKAGSCLWGVFVGAEPVAGKPRGILLVSYGERAEGEERCPSGTDGLPDVLAPGDRLSAVGTYSPYAQTSCAGVVPAPQLRVEAACPVVVSGKGAPVMPVTVSHADADVIAQGTDAAVLRQYAAGLVRLEDVSGLPLSVEVRDRHRSRAPGLLQLDARAARSLPGLSTAQRQLPALVLLSEISFSCEFCGFRTRGFLGGGLWRSSVSCLKKTSWRWPRQSIHVGLGLMRRS